MNSHLCNEADWKHFKSMAPVLRERYLRERNAGIAAILGDESLTPTERFWNAHALVEETAAILRACLDDMRRSRMTQQLMLMHRHGMMVDGDLAGFSAELRERMSALVGILD